MNEIISILSVIVLSVVLGIIVTRFTREELKDGKNWFIALIVLGIFGGIVSFVFGENIMGASCFGISLMGLISLFEGKKLK